LSDIFQIVADDFLEDLASISTLVNLTQGNGVNPKVRIAAVHSTTLLLAATFEEFIREMGRQFAREMVGRTSILSDLPRKLSATAWKRTLEGLARAKIDTGGTNLSLEAIAKDAQSQFDAICGFISGDLSQDIYRSLIHNENNMRPLEINAVFKICDLTDVCSKFSDKATFRDYFEEAESGRAHGLFLTRLNDFFERRNEIAHSLNAASSEGPDQLLKDVEMLKVTAQALAETLPLHLPMHPAAGARAPESTQTGSTPEL
jgi:hypothetical protein